VAPADADVRRIFRLPEDITIRTGHPVPLAFDPATNNLTAVIRFQDHLLVKERYFFTLPPTLWREILQQVGVEKFQEDLIELEDSLGQICGDHSSNAGLLRGQAFPYHHLCRASIGQISAASTGWGMNQARLDHTIRDAEAKLSGLATVARGYLGWLLTNPRFLEEHDALLSEQLSVVDRWGTADFGLPCPPTGFDSATEDERAAFATTNVRFVEFLCRWRLQSLAAPYLPVPLQPLMAGRLPQSILGQYLQTGGLFVVPDTFPVPSRDEFRSMLDQALHGSPPDHLTEWMTIIARNNTAKQAIPRFARIFALQHFWRVLHHRHRLALRRKTTILQRVFASFFKTTERTIFQDLIEIRRRLGAGWIDRGANFPLGPFLVAGSLSWAART
jgi:hypothetical protein